MRELKFNRKIIILLLLSVLVAGSASASSLPEETSTKAIDNVLEILILKAEQNNPLIGAAHERVLRSEAAIQESGAKMGPKLGVVLGALWQENDPLFPSMNPVTGDIIGIVPLGFRNTYAAAVGFVQTVYAGGSLYAGRQAALLAKEALLAEELRVRQKVDNAVRIAYYNRKRATEKQYVAKESVALAQNHLSRAEKLFKSGLVAKGDVLRSKVAVADSELNLIRAGNTLELTLTVLERAVGTMVDPLEIEGKMSAPMFKTLMTSHPSLTEDSLSLAYENRQELKMYSLLSKQADKIARAAQGQLLPQIVAAGALSNVDNEFFPNGNAEWRIGLIAYWTIYDSGEISAKTKQAKAQAREFLYLLDDMKNIVKMEVKQAELNLRSAESRLSVADRQVSESEEDYRIAVRRYEQQVGTNLDMLDARLALINSKTERVDALYDISIAYADLLYAIGR